MGRTRTRATTTSTSGDFYGSGSGSTGTSGTGLKKPEYADDHVQRMPLLNSASQMAAARRLFRQMSARSGRTSTRLVSEGGVRPYIASLLGNPQ